MTKLPHKKIETERLILQPYMVQNYRAVFQLIQKNKPRLIHSFPNMLSATETEAATKDFVQQKIFDWNKNKSFAYHLLLKENHQLVGHFNIKDIDWKNKECELAYFIDVDFEKKGYVSEAIHKILRLAFLFLEMQHVTARVVTSNLASQRVLQKNGMQYEGTFYNAYTTYDLQLVDTYRYGISKDDFLKTATT